MKTFFATNRLYVLAQLIRRHSRGCRICAAASSKGDNMRYDEFCPTGLKLAKAVQKILVPASRGTRPGGV